MPEPQVFQTATAQQRAVTLQDGTDLIIGPESRLQVTYSNGAREVNLTSGEALFSVQPDAGRPFLVYAAGSVIQVTGTVFNVGAVDEVVRVEVAEGSVSVGRRQRGDFVPPRVSLSTGQQVLVSADDGLGRVTEIDPAQVGAWQTGRLTYIQAPLAEIISDANRYCDMEIVILDEAAAQLPVNFTYDGTDVAGMLAILEQALPVTVNRTDDGTARINSQ